jgi:acyl carrier protein
MTDHDVDEIKLLITSRLENAIATTASAQRGISDDFDLRAEGVIDSLGFLELISHLEERLGFAIDLSAMNSEELTRLGPLSQHIAAQKVLTR